MKRVLIIGSGHRVQSGIIPALLRLQKEWEIAGIYSRHIREIGVNGENFTTIDTLSGIDFSALDLIMVAVTLESVPDVLRKLTKFNTSHIRIMLDTPVVKPRDILSLRMLKNFRQAEVTEDSVLLSPFLEAKRVGEIREVRFIHSGYRYHALAAMKVLAGSNYVKKIKNIYSGGKISERHFIFPRGVRGIIIEPRDYRIGQLQITGSQGRFDYDFAQNPMDEIKIAGLAELIADENKSYSIAHGVYDSLAIKFSEKFGFFWDFSAGSKSFWQRVIGFAIGI